jgi:hypothetical protein
MKRMMSMTEFKKTGSPDPGRFSRRVVELKTDLQTRSPARLAAMTGGEWLPESEERGKFRLTLWGSPVEISYPEWTAVRLAENLPTPEFELALLLYYFQTADGAPGEGVWISFSELPDGKVYNQAFLSYTGKELAHIFSEDLPAFQRAAGSLGGTPEALGDAAFRFQALPRVPVLVVYWLGDEDLSSSAQVLFDRSASHYLPTDAYAILGSTITHKLIAARTA